MPAHKDFKRLVRARMEKTGESYTAARSALFRRTSSRSSTSSPAPAPSAGSAVSVNPGMSDAAVKAKTGCDWAHWVWALDKAGAYEWTHREIVRHIAESYKLNSWWSQMVTVGYERIKGLRVPGQARGGAFRMSKSRTLAVSAAALYRRVRDGRNRKGWLPGLRLEVRSVTPGKMIRARLANGVRVEFTFVPKGRGKCQVVVEELGLSDRNAVASRKAYWSKRLGDLG